MSWGKAGGVQLPWDGAVPAGQEQHPSVCGGEGRGAGGSAGRPRPPQALTPTRLPLARQLSWKSSSEAASPRLCRPSFISASYSNACVEVRGEKWVSASWSRTKERGGGEGMLLCIWCRSRRKNWLGAWARTNRSAFTVLLLFLQGR